MGKVVPWHSLVSFGFHVFMSNQGLSNKKNKGMRLTFASLLSNRMARSIICLNKKSEKCDMIKKVHNLRCCNLDIQRAELGIQNLHYRCTDGIIFKKKKNSL